jgi:hypothetical protein
MSGKGAKGLSGKGAKGTMGDKLKGDKRKPTSRSQKAGLQFPVGRIHRLLKVWALARARAIFVEFRALNGLSAPAEPRDGQRACWCYFGRVRRGHSRCAGAWPFWRSSAVAPNDPLTRPRRVSDR